MMQGHPDSGNEGLDAVAEAHAAGTAEKVAGGSETASAELVQKDAGAEEPSSEG